MSFQSSRKASSPMNPSGDQAREARTRQRVCELFSGTAALRIDERPYETLLTNPSHTERCTIHIATDDGYSP